jgi:iron complex transport system substrate-binding protein
LPRRPKVYFEEWDDPLISGIQWVAELVRIAGGDDIFPERAAEPLAKQRILDGWARSRASRAETIIFGSWCGKKFRRKRLAARPGWQAIPPCAMANFTRSSRRSSWRRGPAALSDGVREIAGVIKAWAYARDLRLFVGVVLKDASSSRKIRNI